MKKEGSTAVALLTSHRARQLVRSLFTRGVLQLCLVVSGILLARSLGPTSRGEFAIIVIMPTVAIQVVLFGIPSALTYFIAKGEAGWVLLARRIAPVAGLQIVAAVALTIALRAAFLADASVAAQTAALLSLATIPLLVLQYYGLHILQGLGELALFNRYSVLPAALYSAGLAIGLTVGLTVQTATVVWVASMLLATAPLGHTLIAKGRANQPAAADVGSLGLDRGAIVRFGAAGFLAQVSPVETFRIDTIAVAVLFPAHVVGYYAVASSVANAPRLVADGVVAVAYPHVAHQASSQATASALKYVGVAALGCGVTALAIAAILPCLIPLLFGEAYAPAVSVAVVLVIATALIGIRRVATDCLRALGKPGASSRAELAALVVLGLCLVMLGGRGAGEGVAWSLGISAAVGAALIGALLGRLRTAPSAKLV